MDRPLISHQYAGPPLEEVPTGTGPMDCPLCQKRMIDVHGHMECRGPGGCGFRDSCCEDGEAS